MSYVIDYRSGNWFHIVENSEANPGGWRQNIEQALSDNQVELSDIHASISSGGNVHLWLRPGRNETRMYLDYIPTDDTVRGTLQLLHDGGGVELGYSYGNQPVMWIVTETRPAPGRFQ